MISGSKKNIKKEILKIIGTIFIAALFIISGMWGNHNVLKPMSRQ